MAASLAAVGLDPAVDWLPIAPAAHYLSGGVVTDLEGATALPGLWAAGEAACTGVHGANRLASNSLLEGMVFGARLAEAIDGGRDGPDAHRRHAGPHGSTGRIGHCSIARRLADRGTAPTDGARLAVAGASDRWAPTPTRPVDAEKLGTACSGP